MCAIVDDDANGDILCVCLSCPSCVWLVNDDDEEHADLHVFHVVSGTPSCPRNPLRHGGSELRRGIGENAEVG
ncbi:unnamed protein product [Nippostrongylus brasiliensis]|uniref:Ferredoxin n=1 Tax=Nippostrongylus brasiliensis TaxID=27835 RepID=A0A0N4XUR6_NIPBR|nr:unnamed protein product [Nippostrongylus brasiliensis]